MTAAAREWRAEFDFLTPRGLRHLSAADLSRHSRRARRAVGRRQANRGFRAPTTCISRPRGRSAGRRAPIAWSAGACSRRAITRAFPNIFPRARRFPEDWIYAGAAELPRARGDGDGADAFAAGRTQEPRLRQGEGLDARRRSRALTGRRRRDVLDLPRPIFLCVGRVAVEKNLDALLRLDLPGSTVIVGDGPARARCCSGATRKRISSARSSARSSGADLCQRRRVRVSLAHRHFWHRADRGAGERPARRRVSR